VQPEFRKALGNSFNSDYDEQPRYNGTIGDARARPLGNFSDTAYAYLHKNILVVTVDPFYQEDPNKKISQAGTVAMRITGYQLDWLDQVLGEGRKLPQVKHIFVQAHVPVLHPVKKSRSSGQMMEDEEKSDFWKTLRKYNVDIYFTGEVSGKIHLTAGVRSCSPSYNSIHVSNQSFFSTCTGAPQHSDEG
jgi:hypothetical protein